MRHVFKEDGTEAVLLVDASNAFNSLNRQAALHNLQYLCPSLATILLNTYRNDVCLFIDGRQLLSTEGTTQGDPLAMAMYAISVLPLINALRECDVNQTWFADDATAGGSLNDLRGWWSRLVTLGPAYGYFVNAVKTWLIVKEKSFSIAKEVFSGCGVNVTMEGRHHLGAAIGSRSFVTQHMQEKVNYWVSN